MAGQVRTAGMLQATEQTERTLESGIPSHKVLAMTGKEPGAGADFGVQSLASTSGSASSDGKGSRVRDSARATPPPVRVGRSRAQSAPDHGEGGEY